MTSPAFDPCFSLGRQGGKAPVLVNDLREERSMDRYRCRSELQRDLGAIGPYVLQAKFVVGCVPIFEFWKRASHVLLFSRVKNG